MNMLRQHNLRIKIDHMRTFFITAVKSSDDYVYVYKAKKQLLESCRLGNYRQ